MCRYTLFMQFICNKMDFCCRNLRKIHNKKSDVQAQDKEHYQKIVGDYKACLYSNNSTYLNG